MDGSSSFTLDQRSSAHAGTDAHGDYSVLALGPLEFGEEGGDLPGSGAAEGVSEGDGSSLRVHLLLVDAQLLHTVGGLTGKGLVDFPDVHLFHLDS